MLQSRCILLSSCKHYLIYFQYRAEQGKDHVGGADPLRGMAGRVRKLRRWRQGVGPPEGSGRAFFAF